MLKFQIGKINDFCLDDCPFRSMQVPHVNNQYADQKLVSSEIHIYCAHDNLCKLWAETTKKEKEELLTDVLCGNHGDFKVLGGEIKGLKFGAEGNNACDEELA